MFTNISWKEYTIFILITLIIYYFILLIVFYKAEFARFINNLHLRNAGSNFNGEYSLLENNKEELLSDNIETPAIINRLQNEITMQLEGGKIKAGQRGNYNVITIGSPAL